MGIDDCPFIPRSSGKNRIIGTVFRGGYWLDGLLHTKIEIDGLDATEKIAEMVMSSPHSHQLRVLMLNGITLAGFNVVDIKKLYDLTLIPVIALTREKINGNRVEKALKQLPMFKERLLKVKKAGKIFKVQVNKTELNVHVQGISIKDASKIIQITSTRGNIPEALRVAHLIASGLGKREDQ